MPQPLLEFQAVSYTYPSATQAAIQNLDLAIFAGQKKENCCTTMHLCCTYFHSATPFTHSILCGWGLQSGIPTNAAAFADNSQVERWQDVEAD